MTEAEAKELKVREKQELSTDTEQTRPGPVYTPDVDIFESETDITLLADMPGITTEKMAIDLRDDVLTLTGEAETDGEASEDPSPVALFLSFGESSLDFELRAWIADFNERRIIQSDLVRGIDRQFRIAGIEIPFPQRDLHIRSVDEKASESIHRSQQLNTDAIDN